MSHEWMKVSWRTREGSQTLNALSELQLRTGLKVDMKDEQLLYYLRSIIKNEVEKRYWEQKQVLYLAKGICCFLKNLRTGETFSRAQLRNIKKVAYLWQQELAGKDQDYDPFQFCPVFILNHLSKLQKRELLYRRVRALPSVATIERAVSKMLHSHRCLRKLYDASCSEVSMIDWMIDNDNRQAQVYLYRTIPAGSYRFFNLINKGIKDIDLHAVILSNQYSYLVDNPLLEEVGVTEKLNLHFSYSTRNIIQS